MKDHLVIVKEREQCNIKKAEEKVRKAALRTRWGLQNWFGRSCVLRMICLNDVVVKLRFFLGMLTTKCWW